MTDYGVTDEGFVLKRLADILTDMKATLSSVVDPVSGEALTPDLLNENDPLIQMVNSLSDQVAVCWENLQLAYNQFDPLKATGAGLSGTVQLNGLRRTAGTYSEVIVTLTGVPGLSIAAGKQISTMENVPVFELPLCQIGEDGTVNVTATCTEKGPFEVTAGTLVKILNPVSGWSSVVNSLDATPGSYEEIDSELRARQQISTSNTAQAIIESIVASIGNLASVEYVKVYHNVTIEEDDRGIPAKSIAPIVVGGSDEEIAQAIYYKLPVGCDTYGDEEVIITDSQEIDYTIRFSRPTEIDIHVIVEITTVNTNLFPDDGDEQIKTAILTWATQGASAFNITEGYDQDGFTPGQSVYASELMVPVYSIPGIKVDSILIGASSPATESEVTIEWNEIAVFDSENITVVINGESS